MKKIKVLEVNNIDLQGRRFNGYDMIKEISDETIEIKQAVIEKESNNESVVKILKNSNSKLVHAVFDGVETELSVHNIFSITTPSLQAMPEYKEADIIHFHMFHNTKLSLYSLIKMANEKKVVVSLHDPWFLTGRCVHFFECPKWKTGCQNCNSLNTMFSLKKDNCSVLWNLKKYVFDHINVDLAVPSEWMSDLVKSSPIMKKQKNIHKIPFGIDVEKFSSTTYKEARKKLEISDDEIVLFFRSQNEFKGTPYIVEALKMLDSNKKITLLTCDNKGLISDLKGKYRIIELGKINDKEMVCAMNACDIFLMPSVGEAFGMMAIEAMSCAKPVIVFDNSALPSVTHAPKCGYLVKNKDSNDLMKAIKHLVENDKERHKRGELGKKIVNKEYTYEAYNKSIKELYFNVMKKKHKPVTLDKTKYNIKNENNFKAYLNKLTLRLYGENKIAKDALYIEYDKSNVNENEEIDFTDMNIYPILEEYLENLEILTRNKKIKVKKTNAFQRAWFYLVHDRKLLQEKIMNRLRRK